MQQSELVTEFSKLKFEYEKIEISFKDLYKYFKREESPLQSFTYIPLYNFLGIHSLFHKNNEVKYYFSEKKFKLNLVCSTNNSLKNYEVYSNYEINKIIKENKINNLFFEQENYGEYANYFLRENDTITFYYELEEKIELNNASNDIKVFSLTESVYPKDLSCNYSLYFEDNINNKIEYFISDEKKIYFRE